MALKPCYECNTEISTKAILCPKCGDPLWKWKLKGLIVISRFTGLIVLGIPLFVIAFFIYLPKALNDYFKGNLEDTPKPEWPSKLKRYWNESKKEMFDSKSEEEEEEEEPKYESFFTRLHRLERITRDGISKVREDDEKERLSEEWSQGKNTSLIYRINEFLEETKEKKDERKMVNELLEEQRKKEKDEKNS
jgi:hypothetical protein